MSLFNFYDKVIRKTKKDSIRDTIKRGYIQEKKCKALLIGINYKGTSSELNGCINDIKRMGKMLKKLNPSIEIKYLSEEKTELPTRENIINGIKWLVKDNDKYDKVFFHYSGHGTSIRDVSGDEHDYRDEAICPLDYATNGLIIDDLLHELLITPMKTELVAVMDCCHSSTAMDLKYTYTARPSLKRRNKYNVNSYATNYSLKDENLDLLDMKNNIILISGCKDNQTSADAYISGKYQGALTHSLITTLEKNNYKLTYSELLKEIHLRLKFKKFTQTPTMSTMKLMSLGKQFEMM